MAQLRGTGKGGEKQGYHSIRGGSQTWYGGTHLLAALRKSVQEDRKFTVILGYKVNLRSAGATCDC